MNIEEKLREQIKENNILIYMKGTPYEPRCGFSARTVQILIECDSEFSYVDILENNDVRTTLPKVSDWPTFPQVFINGELIGCLLYTSPSPRDKRQSRMPSSA